MIEVLVTLVIIAVGLLGLAAMMSVSLKSNRIALQRSAATLYANDIIDCMRVNRQAATTGAYTLAAFGATLTGTSVATNDINAWQAALNATLPSGQGKITLASNRVTVEIRWSESLNAADNATHTWRTESTL